MKKIILSVFFSSSIALATLAQSFSQEGLASYYADNLAGSYTAYGEAYNPEFKTASHATLPVNTMVKITNLVNGKAVIVKINDKLPENSKKSVMLSKSAAAEIDLLISGCVKVKIEEINTNTIADESIKVLSQNQKNEDSDKQLFASAGTYNCEGVAQLAKGYGVQVAALASMKAFKHLCNDLSTKSIGDAIYVQVIETVDKGKLYRVLIGNYDTYEAAKGKLAQIATLGYKPVIRTHSNTPTAANSVSAK
jgi:rare lipoprotein A